MELKEQQLGGDSPFCFSVPLNPRPVAECRFGRSGNSGEEVKRTPKWEFHECSEELVTFTEVCQKRFPLLGRHTRGVVICGRR